MQGPSYGPKEYGAFPVRNHSASPSCPRHLQPQLQSWQQDACGDVRSSDETTVMYVKMLLLFQTFGFIAIQLAWHQDRYMWRVLLGVSVVVVAEQAGKPLEPSGGQSNVP
jgi:hypothetical protein